MTKPEVFRLPIRAVERETGVPRETLRKWEARYGFPQPERDAAGERQYAEQDLARLKRIKRLLNAGWRPGAVVGLAESELAALEGESQPTGDEGLSDQAQSVLELLMRNDPVGVQNLLRQLLLRQGLRAFVVETVADLNGAVGRAWERGLLTVFQEHLYSALVRDFLDEAVAVARPRQPRRSVLLTTPNGEQHALGLLMAKALCNLAGYQCHDLGTQLPNAEIASAAQALGADVVALSLSVHYPRKHAARVVDELRALLRANTALWVGGAGAAHLPQGKPGVKVFGTIAELDAALQASM